MDLHCRSQCMLFLNSLGLTDAHQWGHAVLSMVLLWLIINTLLLNRWILLQQCQAARALASRLMHIHLGHYHKTNMEDQNHRIPTCQSLLSANDHAFKYMLASVLDAKTFQDQVTYSQKKDKLLKSTPPLRLHKLFRSGNTLSVFDSFWHSSYCV